MIRKRVLVPLAEGFEEIEAVTIIDILRRAGADVTTAGLGKRNVMGSHAIPMITDSVIEEEKIKSWDMIVLPGGLPGATNLADNENILELIRGLSKKGKIVAAICASPVALERAGVLSGKKVTSHPTSSKDILSGDYRETRVMKDGNIITGQACGSAMEFAFELVAALLGSKKVGEINQSILSNLLNENKESEN